MSFTRRSFFKRAGGLIASVAIAQGIVRKLFDTATASSVNPEWVTSPYEMDFLFEPTTYMGRVEFNRSPWINLLKRGKFPAGIGDTVEVVAGEWKQE